MEKNEVKIIQWSMLHKGKPLIRFEDGGAPLNVDKAVLDLYNQKDVIQKGTAMEVKYNDKGDVIFLKEAVKGKEEVKKEEPKVTEKREVPKPLENPLGMPDKETVEWDSKEEMTNKEAQKEIDNNTAVISEEAIVPEEEVKKEASNELIATIYAIARNKKVVKFGKDEKWFPISTNFQKEDFEKVNFKAGKKLKLRIVNNEVEEVLSIIEPPKVEQEKKEAPKEKTEQKKSSWRDEDLTDRRTALMSSVNIVTALINSKSDKVTTVEKINTLLNDFSNTCLQIIKKG